MNIGFIGAGNMAGALIQGIIKGEILSGANVHVYDTNRARLDQLVSAFDVRAHGTCADMIASAGIIVLAVKPNVVAKVLEEEKSALKDKALISIAAGWTSRMLSNALDPATRVLRVMPNTPALVTCGMTAFSSSHTLTDWEKAFAERVFESLGKLIWVREDQMEAVIGVSGSGPAYAYLFIEALADAGVYMGLARDQAMVMAAQTLKGAGEMVLESGSHPGLLKDAVCSPGGTTIAAVKVLEEKGLRAAVIDAAVAAYDKAVQMSKA